MKVGACLLRNQVPGQATGQQLPWELHQVQNRRSTFPNSSMYHSGLTVRVGHLQFVHTHLPHPPLSSPPPPPEIHLSNLAFHNMQPPRHPPSWSILPPMLLPLP